MYDKYRQLSDILLAMSGPVRGVNMPIIQSLVCQIIVET